jgi:hypothetical protein
VAQQHEERASTGRSWRGVAEVEAQAPASARWAAVEGGTGETADQPLAHARSRFCVQTFGGDQKKAAEEGHGMKGQQPNPRRPRRVGRRGTPTTIRIPPQALFAS